MVCKKCKTVTDDDSIYCINCGERIESEASVIKPKKSKRIVVIVFTLFLIAFSSFYIANNIGYKSALNKYFKAYEKNSPELRCAALAQYWVDSWGEESALALAQEDIESKIKKWGCGSDIDITYKVLNERKATKQQLEALEENIYDWNVPKHASEEFSISGAYVLEIEFTIKGDERTKTRNLNNLLLIKENGKWRIATGWINCPFYNNQ